MPKRVPNIEGLVLTLDEIRGMDTKTMVQNMDLINRSLRVAAKSPPKPVELKSITCVGDLRGMTTKEMVENLPAVTELLRAFKPKTVSPG